jgi:hypothetical protein
MWWCNMETLEQQKTEPPLLAVGPDKASQITDTSRTRIFQAIRDGELTARKAGKSTIIEVYELRRWVRSLPTRGRKPVELIGSGEWETEPRKVTLRSIKPAAIACLLKQIPTRRRNHAPVETAGAGPVKRDPAMIKEPPKRKRRSA